jgi:hypothetical protein
MTSTADGVVMKFGNNIQAITVLTAVARKERQKREVVRSASDASLELLSLGVCIVVLPPSYRCNGFS